MRTNTWLIAFVKQWELLRQTPVHARMHSRRLRFTAGRDASWADCRHRTCNEGRDRRVPRCLVTGDQAGSIISTPDYDYLDLIS